MRETVTDRFLNKRIARRPLDGAFEDTVGSDYYTDTSSPTQIYGSGSKDKTKESELLKSSSESLEVAEGPTVYFGAYSNNLYALDASTGQERWVYTDWSSGVRSSPTVVAGTVYVAVGKALYALNAATGDQEWVFNDPTDGIGSSPTVVNGTVYIGSNDQTLYAVNADSGIQEWAFTEPSDSVWSSPTVINGTAFVGSQDGRLYAVDADTGNREWTFTEPSGGINSSPTVANGIVYFGSKDTTLYAVDTDTGNQEWTFTEPSDTIRSSPTVVDGTVYVGSGIDSEGILYAIDADTGSTDWKVDVSEPVMRSSPAVSNGIVYVGTGEETGWQGGTLYAINAANGTVEWSFSVSEIINTTPTVYNGMVYFGSQNNSTYALDADTGSQQWEYDIGGVSNGVHSSPTVVKDPNEGASVGSRINLGTLGHHHSWADQGATTDSTIVSLSPIETTVPQGNKVTFDLVVENIDGGIGSHRSLVTLSGSSIATITDVTLLGSPDEEYIDISTDGTTVDMAAALMDTEVTGPVGIGQIDVKVDETGTTDLNLSVKTLSDKVGHTYTVSGTSGATVTGVPESISVNVTDQSLNIGGEAEVPITAFNANYIDIRQLWTDWEVTANQVDGGQFTDVVSAEGKCQFEWNNVQESISASILVEPPDRYVGGEYVLDITATDSSGNSAQTTALIRITDQ